MEMRDYTEDALAALYPVKFCHNNCSSELLPRDAFNRNVYNKDGLQNDCRECQKGKRLNAQRRRKLKEEEFEERLCAKCHKMFIPSGKYITRCDECKKKELYSEADLGGS